MTVGFIGGKFLPLHMGHAYAIIMASTMVDKLYAVLSYSSMRDRELCGRDGCRYITPELRLSWLKELTRGMSHIECIAIEDTYGNEDYDWGEGARQIKERIGTHIDYVFGSEKGYEEVFRRNYPDSEYVLIDPGRERFPISATEIRRDPYSHWEMLPEFVRPFFAKKVVIVGTESCGKSTLAAELARLYNTSLVEETGRKLCTEAGGPDCLTPELYRRILLEHKLAEEEGIKKANKVVFIDTEALVTEYYAYLYSNYKDHLFEEVASKQDYDLWLYMEPDVKWFGDGERRHGEDKVREGNNRMLKAMLDERGIRYVSISGSYQERLEQAVKIVDGLIGKR